MVPEAVEGPRLAPGPCGVRSPTLLGRLAKELPGVKVEDSFVRDASIAPDEVASRVQAVRFGDGSEPLVVAGVSGVLDDADVHHDVDECRVLGQEGP